MDWGQFFVEKGPAFFWLFVAIAAAITEGMTFGLVAIWFVPGALAAMLVSFFVEAVWVQVAVFLALSVLTLVLTKTVFKKHLPQHTSTRMNADALIEDHGVVVEEINNLRETGSVKVNALIWTARSTDDSVILPVGTLVTIKEISGVKLICAAREPSHETEKK
ncbi:MAG: NfeD family protein [Ruminococcaceae bacterium]|nr:NfeD family protein [Oscillospiraceae bacterium]